MRSLLNLFRSHSSRHLPWVSLNASNDSVRVRPLLCPFIRLPDDNNLLACKSARQHNSDLLTKYVQLHVSQCYCFEAANLSWLVDLGHLQGTSASSQQFVPFKGIRMDKSSRDGRTGGLGIYVVHAGASRASTASSLTLTNSAMSCTRYRFTS